MTCKVQMNKNNTICLSSISSTAIQCSLLRYVLSSVIMIFFNDNISRAVTVGSSFFCTPNIMIVMTPNKIVLLFSHLSRIPRYAMLVVCVPCQPFCLLFVGIVWLALTLGNKVKKYVLTSIEIKSFFVNKSAPLCNFGIKWTRITLQ